MEFSAVWWRVTATETNHTQAHAHTHRWNLVPSYAPLAASARKFCVLCGVVWMASHV